MMMLYRILFMLFIHQSAFVRCQTSYEEPWCLRGVEPSSVKYAFVLPNIEEHLCSDLCYAIPEYSMLTYFYNKTCALYAFSAVMAATFKINPTTLETCILKNVTEIASSFGTTASKLLELPYDDFCVNGYNVVAANVQSVPPDPPYSPSTIQECSEACHNVSTCALYTYQPKYKILNVSACWLKGAFGSGINGHTEPDSMTLSTCFKNLSEYMELGLTEAYHLQFKIPYVPISSGQMTVVHTLIVVIVLSLYFLLLN